MVITSNNEKELPDAFLRRCVFHYIEFPDKQTMTDIVRVHHPDVEEELLRQVLLRFYWLRELPEIRKRPSTSELIDWIAALAARRHHARDDRKRTAVPGRAAQARERHRDGAGQSPLRTRELAIAAAAQQSRSERPWYSSLQTSDHVRRLLLPPPRLRPEGLEHRVAGADARRSPAGHARADLNTFYHLARCLLVKRESDYDTYDRAFASFFAGIEHQTDI